MNLNNILWTKMADHRVPKHPSTQAPGLQAHSATIHFYVGAVKFEFKFLWKPSYPQIHFPRLLAFDFLRFKNVYLFLNT